MSHKLLSIFLLVIGEVLSVSAEMVAARDHDRVSFLSNLARTFPVIALAGAFLIGGYILGYSSFKNIWIITAVSVTSILIVEPATAFILFGDRPTMGAIIGLALGAFGLVVTVVVK